MKILCDDIQLILDNAENNAAADIALQPGIVQNLTEKWTYPKNMPDSMTFNLMKEDITIGQAAFKSIRWFNRKAELSLFIHPDFQGRQYGTRILRAMIAHAFNHLNLHRLEAEVIRYNPAAIKLVEKLGFVNEGCLREARYFDGKYHDIFRYGLLKSDIRL
jgi:RimJ/RimL family protein N-acetyltransferase